MDYQNEKMVQLWLLGAYTSTWFISLVCAHVLRSQSGTLAQWRISQLKRRPPPSLPTILTTSATSWRKFILLACGSDGSQTNLKALVSETLLYQMTCRKPGMPPRCLIKHDSALYKSLDRVQSSLPTTSAQRIQRLPKPQLLFSSTNKICTCISLCLLFCEVYVFHHYVLKNRLTVQQDRQNEAMS